MSSLELDRARGAIYARGGAPTCWLLDVVSRRLEIRTGPTPAGTWRVVTQLDETGAASLPGLDEALGVATLLP